MHAKLNRYSSSTTKLLRLHETFVELGLGLFDAPVHGLRNVRRDHQRAIRAGLTKGAFGFVGSD